jgi:hypothetical protein
MDSIKIGCAHLVMSAVSISRNATSSSPQAAGVLAIWLNFRERRHLERNSLNARAPIGDAGRRIYPKFNPTGFVIKGSLDAIH